MTIARAECAGDFLDFHELLVEYEGVLPAELRHGSVPSANELRASYAKRSAAFLAKMGSAIAGCVAVTELDAKTAIIVRLFVRPAHRGAGAARALVGAAIEFMREAGYNRAVLDTDKERLAAAYQLYLSLGFTECEPYEPQSYEHPTFLERPLDLEL